MVQVHLHIEKIAAFGSSYMGLRTPVELPKAAIFSG